METSRFVIKRVEDLGVKGGDGGVNMGVLIELIIG